MHELQELISVLLLYRSNFHVLHWNAVGKEFDSTHKNITAEYYDDCLETADVIAEMTAKSLVFGRGRKKPGEYRLQ